MERDGQFLMIQRSEQVRAPGLWCFPGGGIERGETPAQAIVREFEEELGLVVKPIRELWSWLREDGGLFLYWWEVAITGGELQPAPAEVQAVEWMSEERIRNHDQMIPNNVRFLDHYRGTS